MSFESGGFLDDIMDDLLYPESKWVSLKKGILLLFFYPILVLLILPLSYFISFIIGFFNSSPYKKCDRCRRLKLNNVNSPHKFFWFCEDCLDDYTKFEEKFVKE